MYDKIFQTKEHNLICTIKQKNTIEYDATKSEKKKPEEQNLISQGAMLLKIQNVASRDH